MPPYEVTLYFRPLQKEMLVDAIKKAVTSVLGEGVVIMDLRSLGYRDLPVRSRVPLTGEPVYTSNSVLLNTSMSKDMLNRTIGHLKINNDLVRYGIVNTDTAVEPPEECTLEEMFKSPANRKSVTELRRSQTMSQVMRLRVYKNTRRAWRMIPKSYFTAPTKR